MGNGSAKVVVAFVTAIPFQPAKRVWRTDGRGQPVVWIFPIIIPEEEQRTDKIRYFAVVKNVEIIGEAAYMLSSEFKEKNGHIPWNNIIRMRHVLVHGYATIQPELLWHTALIDVPLLKTQVEELVAPAISHEAER